VLAARGGRPRGAGGARAAKRRGPPATAEIEGGAHARPRTRIAAGRCEAAAVQLQRAAVERGAPADDPELRPAGPVRMVRCEIERDVGVLDEGSAGEARLQTQEGRRVEEAEP